ncbi:phosphatidate cytidylyltransferase [Hydrogenophaga sp. D2P1]|uniref:Phosphatidate cytidylyltransferase n=1 Tax=Hydrogenophaga aromaticivorans TaxID=2610898 RepID=A0A7Y8GW95_9BURK|nr:phosphatidate cytidylyltransferase [Hydrogenophaga aromaticivorans]NWF45242.1 phosphatidate cytidylyltransferase [Hydrogenophaga aromaticivorans]
MLKQRIITALLLMAVLLPALFYPSSEPFVLLSLLLMVAGGWEWARLNACAPTMAKAVGLGLGLALLAFWLLGGLEQTWRPVWLVSSLVWVGLAVVMLRRGVAGWSAWPAAIRLGLGLLLLACAWLALVQARQLGVGFLLSVLSLVWMADIAAYAGGRAFGRRKLAPTLSPGKSWEGVVSGLAGVLLLGLGWRWFDGQQLTDQPSLFTRLQTLGELVSWLAVIGLTAMSVVGDLLESLVKRSAGMKDSSQLLPGHGGVLDRVDALLPVLPLAMMLVTL